MTFQRGRKLIAQLWVVGAFALFFVMVAQSIGDLYGSKLTEAWGWFLPTVMPTLSMIVGVFIADYQHREQHADDDRDVGLLAWFGIVLSVMYLLLVATPIVAPAFRPTKPPLELMKQSMIWLGGIQGLTAGVLAVFFQTAKGPAR